MYEVNTCMSSASFSGHPFYYSTPSCRQMGHPKLSPSQQTGHPLSWTPQRYALRCGGMLLLTVPALSWSPHSAVQSSWGLSMPLSRHRPILPRGFLAGYVLIPTQSQVATPHPANGKVRMQGWLPSRQIARELAQHSTLNGAHCHPSTLHCSCCIHPATSQSA
jgi:hypothetical protein